MSDGVMEGGCADSSDLTDYTRIKMVREILLNWLRVES